MKVRQNDTLLALRRVQGFLTANAAALGGVNTSGARADLDAAVSQLTALAVTQKQGTQQAQGDTTKQAILRSALIQSYMAPIAAIARAKLATVPEFSALKLPAPGIHAQALITAAAAMGNAAVPYAATFVQQGLATDFVAQLAGAATALQAGIDARSATNGAKIGATAGAASQVKSARAVLGVLNTLVTPQLTNNPTLLKAWLNAKKITGNGALPVASTGTLTALLGATPPSPVAPANPPVPDPSPDPTPDPTPDSTPAAASTSAPAPPTQATSTQAAA